VIDKASLLEMLKSSSVGIFWFKSDYSDFETQLCTMEFTDADIMRKEYYSK
jgi:hypothetical protein